MRAHIYTAGTGKAVTHDDIDETASFATLVNVDAAEKVFLVGSEQEIDTEVTLRQVGVGETAHFVVHRCENVNLHVGYTGRDLDEKAHVTTLVSKVLDKTAKHLGISDSDAADLVFRISGTNDELDEAAPIGSYVANGTCSLVLDLVHLVRSAG